MTVVLMWAAFFCGDPAESFDDFFTRFVEKRREIHLLEAEFKQTIKTGDDRRTAAGVLRYASPRRLMFHYAPPDELVYLVDDQTIYEYDPEIEQLRIHDLEDDARAEALFLGFDDEPARLQAAYTIAFLEKPEESDDVTVLELEPKTDEENPYFESARVYMRAPFYLPYRIRLKTDADSDVVFDVTDYRINPVLEPEKTQIRLPEGTLIVRNDMPVETVGPRGMLIPEAVREIQDKAQTAPMRVPTDPDDTP